MLWTTGAAVVAAAIMVSTSACDPADAPNHTVIGKRHFVDEKKVEHWVVDCRVGQKLDKFGHKTADVRADEVSKAAYDATTEGSKC